MLTYKKIVPFFVFLLLAVGVYDWFAYITPWIYAGIIFTGVSILFYGSKCIQANFYMTSLCKGSGSEKAIVLTFDDGPDAQVTPLILDVLKKYNVKATFFVIGSRAENNPGIIQRIHKEGHLLGGHSFSHQFFFDLLPEGTIKKEMQKTEALIFSLTGMRTKIFRPPYGVTNPPLARSVKAMGYTSIGWSVKSNDTLIKDPAVILERLKQKIGAGDIVLFHDNKTWNVESVELFLKYLQDCNYSVRPLDKLLKIQAYDQ